MESQAPEKNSYINPFEMLGRVLPLLVTAPVYRDRSISELGTRIMAAVASGKIRYYFRGHSLIGFVTWAYFTSEEARTSEFDWNEVLMRSEGEELWIVDMVGLDSVLYICKDLRRYLSETTNHKVAYWRRSKNGRRLGKAWRLR